MDLSSIFLPSSVAPSLYGSVISEWTDPWSDSSICPLRNIPSLIGWLRVINVVGIRGIYLVVNLLERSVLSSSVLFPLYKLASSSLIFHFPQKSERYRHPCQTNISFTWCTCHLHIFAAHLQLVSTLLLPFKFLIF